jgi:hypothetical protein
VLFACLTGRPPFPGTVPEVIQGHLGSAVPSVTSLVVLPTAVDDVLRRGMGKTPAERFGSCRELIAAARAALAPVARPGSPPPLRRQSSIPSRSVSGPERAGVPPPAVSPSASSARPVRLRDPLPAQPASFATTGGGAGWVMPVLVGLVAVVLLVVVILVVAA